MFGDPVAHPRTLVDRLVYPWAPKSRQSTMPPSAVLKGGKSSSITSKTERRYDVAPLSRYDLSESPDQFLNRTLVRERIWCVEFCSIRRTRKQVRPARCTPLASTLLSPPVSGSLRRDPRQKVARASAGHQRKLRKLVPIVVELTMPLSPHVYMELDSSLAIERAHSGFSD